jgi:ABC-type nickel/cobalt efflux system permease component RcnA
MRRSLLTLALLLAAGLMLLWAQGGLDGLAGMARDLQRTAQNAMAGTLRALRAGEAGALAALIGLAFGYGVAHAAGPGHGKLLIGGYGAATEVRLAPLAGIALAAGLAQATTAVLLVHGGLLLADWTRAGLTDLGEGALAQASAAAIGLIGLWLALRGARRLVRQLSPAPALAHAHAHPHAHHDAACCNHRHGPAPEEVAALAGWRDAALLIGAIALRPCTGALFLLLLTWRMEIPAAGILATYAMGLGTALITAGVAALAVSAREGALMWSGRLGALRPLAPLLELGFGLLIALVALQALRAGV